MGKVVITHEFDSVEEAIAALGKLAGLVPAAAAPKSDTPSVEKPPRKGRSDAGVPRGPQGGVPPAPPATPPAPQVPPVAPQTPPPSAPATVVPITDDTVQAAVEKLFNKIDYDGTFMALSKFGVKRGKDLPQTVRAEFLQRVEDLVAAKYGVGDSWPAV